MTDRAEPGDPLDLDQIQKALDRYWALWPQLVAPDENVGAVMTELALILPRDRTAKWLGSVLAALRDARQRVQELEVRPVVTVVRDEAGLHQEHIDSQVAPDLEATVATLRDVRAALAAAAEREARLRERLESAVREAVMTYADACGDGLDADAAYEMAMGVLNEMLPWPLPVSPTPTEPHR